MVEHLSVQSVFEQVMHHIPWHHRPEIIVRPLSAARSFWCRISTEGKSRIVLTGTTPRHYEEGLVLLGYDALMPLTTTGVYAPFDDASSIV